MKRNMQLMRELLFEIEDKFEPGVEVMKSFEVSGYDTAIIADHYDLLYQAGLIKQYIPMRGGVGNRVIAFDVGNLTNAGHDYLELIRNDKTWEEVNAEIREKNLPHTIEVYGTVAASIAGAFMREFYK